MPLLQERLGRRDVWRVAIICALLNRARAEQAEPALRALFLRWPACQDLDSALHDQGERDSLRAMLAPLGLFAGRWRAVAAITAEAARSRGLRKAERVALLRGAPGIGPYALASLRAFCLGDLEARCADGPFTARVRYLRLREKRAAAVEYTA